MCACVRESFCVRACVLARIRAGRERPGSDPRAPRHTQVPTIPAILRVMLQVGLRVVLRAILRTVRLLLRVTVRASPNSPPNDVPSRSPRLYILYKMFAGR